MDKPLKTIQSAVELSRTLIPGSTIVLRGGFTPDLTMISDILLGFHFLNDTVHLGPEDSFLTLRGMPGEARALLSLTAASHCQRRYTPADDVGAACWICEGVTGWTERGAYGCCARARRFGPASHHPW